jgi:hypothetical protein
MITIRRHLRSTNSETLTEIYGLPVPINATYSPSTKNLSTKDPSKLIILYILTYYFQESSKAIMEGTSTSTKWYNNPGGLQPFDVSEK